MQAQWTPVAKIWTNSIIRLRARARLQFLIDYDLNSLTGSMEVHLPQRGEMLRGQIPLFEAVKNPTLRILPGCPPEHRISHESLYPVQTEPGKSTRDPHFTHTVYSGEIDAYVPPASALICASICEPIANAIVDELDNRTNAMQQRIAEEGAAIMQSLARKARVEVSVSASNMLKMVDNGMSSHP